MDYSDMSQPSTQLDRLSELMKGGRLYPLRRMLNGLHPGEVAHLLQSIPRTERKLVWGLLDHDISGEVLVELGDEARAHLVDDMQPEELLKLAEKLETDDLADLIQDLPDTVTAEVLELLKESDRHRLEAVLSFDEATAGGLMNTDTVTVRPNVTLEVVLRYLRLRGDLPRHTDRLMVVDRNDRYLGSLPMRRLVTNDPEVTVQEVMKVDGVPIHSSMPETDVAKLFEQRNLVSAAVVDDSGRLIGRITVDDVVDVIRDEAEHSLLSRAGLSEEDDIFAAVIPSARKRAIWLGVNLLTALLAAWVIGQFQATLEKVVALAVLMPIVASMGGIAGTQTLTLVIRGMALDQIGKKNTPWLLYKEMAVGALNGLFWSLVVAGIAMVWFDSPEIGMVIAVAMLVNLIVAALSGVLVPVTMKRFSIDPALAGGVVLTTITDVIGFLTFLGLATVVLH